MTVSTDHPRVAPDPEEPGEELARFRKTKQRKDIVIVGFFVIAITFFLLIPRMVVIIHAGEAGVLFRRFQGGTVTDRVFGEGVHFLLPWNQMVPYNVRLQATNVNFTILAESAMAMSVEMTIRYRPVYDLVGLLHRRVGPEYVNTVVVPEVKQALRTVVGDYTAEEIYTTQRAILEKVVEKSSDALEQRYIELDNVVIERVILPERIKAAVEAKLSEQQAMEAYEFIVKREQREKERKIIEAEGYNEANKILTNTLTAEILKWRGIEATRMLGTNANSKVVIIGNTPGSLPVILGNP
ncbi:MAG: prohibitin family protein [Verrucomicrobia bacterium]|nr:prohibitin family protein [Verrucomicrobiota bacterium]